MDQVNQVDEVNLVYRAILEKPGYQELLGPQANLAR